MNKRPLLPPQQLTSTEEMLLYLGMVAQTSNSTIWKALEERFEVRKAWGNNVETLSQNEIDIMHNPNNLCSKGNYSKQVWEYSSWLS